MGVASPADVAGWDLYTTALHELGHALGFDNTPGGHSLISNYLVQTNIDDPNDTRPGNLVAVNIGGGPIESTMTNVDTGHLWEGPGTAATNAAGLPWHPSILMNSGRANVAGERNLISDTDAQLLGQVYGYTITLPRTLNNMYVDSNQTSSTLTVTGQSGSSNDFIEVKRSTIPTGLLVTVGTVGGSLFYSEIVPFSQTDSITVNGFNGNDIIRLEDNAGKPTTLNGGIGNDYHRLLVRAAEPDEHHGQHRSTAGARQRPGLRLRQQRRRRSDVHRSPSPASTGPAGAGSATQTDIESRHLTTGTAADHVNVRSTFTNQPVCLITSAGGPTRSTSATPPTASAASTPTCRSRTIPSSHTLNINNGPDTGARTWNVDGSATSATSSAWRRPTSSGTTPTSQAINLTCGSGVDTGAFVLSTETFNVNNTGSNDFITVGAPAASGLGGITGQITIDNAPAFTMLTIDDTGTAFRARSRSTKSAATTPSRGAPALIRFDSVDEFSATVITGGGDRHGQRAAQRRDLRSSAAAATTSSTSATPPTACRHSARP